jgi:hypothetical protein
VDINNRVVRPYQASYRNGPNGFVGVEVLGVEINSKRNQLVYNLEVDEDETYVCQNTLVHNCFQEQTPFMMRRGLAAHVGGWIVEITIGELVNQIKTEFVDFYS